MPLLCQLQNLNLHYGQKVIFNDGKFVLHTNEIVGLIGLNGRGKSTLLRILAGLEKPDLCTPAFSFEKSASQTSNQAFSAFYLPQELPIAKNTDHTVENYYLEFHPRLKKIKERLRLIENNIAQGANQKNLLEQQNLLEQWEHYKGWEIEQHYLGHAQYLLGDNLDKKVCLMSGGEQRKMALAIAMSAPHNLILWDEPTNHLDIQTIEWFEKWLLQSPKAHVIVTHDRYLLSRVSDRIFHIDRGHIHTYEGNYEQYLDFLKEQSEILKRKAEKLSNKERRETAWMRQGIKARGTRSKKRVERYQQLQKELKDIKNQTPKKVDFNLLDSGRKTKILIQVKDLSFSYPNAKTLFYNLNFTIGRGRKIALLGDNGTGKSTLVQLIRGAQTAKNGHIKRANDLRIAYFDQKKQSLDENKTILEVVGQGEEFIENEQGRRQHVYSYMENFLFSSEELARPISSFSGGEKNRIQLALFMKRPADLWIFDEPTNDLDIETISILENEIQAFNGSVLLIGHDRAFIDNIAEQCWLIHNQQLEMFEGGFFQVEAYLQSLRRQKSDTSPSPQKTKTTLPKKTKLTNKQKMRSQVIEREIQEQEHILEDLKMQVANFDYQTIDPQKNIDLKKLTEKIQHQEKHINTLYQEWEELEKLC